MNCRTFRLMYGWLRRWVAVEEGEESQLLLSSGYFFFLMAAYYILQPLRDEIGLVVGKDAIPSLFRWSMLVMLLVNPLFSLSLRAFARSRLVLLYHHLFALQILGFWWALYQHPGPGLAPWLFYLWVSVFNLFVVSLFWSRMADLFVSEQSKRLFGFIGAGGSLGQLAGSQLALWLAPHLGPTHLLLLSALLLELSLACAMLLKQSSSEPEAPLQQAGAASGIAPVFRSTYLLGICLYLFLYTFTSSFLYFQKQELVAAGIESRESRVQFFAALNSIGSVATIAVQLFLTGRFLTSLGLTAGLALVPGLTSLGFVALALRPDLVFFSLFEVSRRTLNYAIARPSREALFTVVPREQKYASKNFIDTFVYRGGDALASVAFEALTQGARLGIVGVSWVAVPCSLLWLAVGGLLGRAQRRKTTTPP